MKNLFSFLQEGQNKEKKKKRSVKCSVISNLDFSDYNSLSVKVSVFKCFMMFARRFTAIFPSANICSFGP